MKRVSGHLQRWDADGIHLMDGHSDSELSFKGLDPDTVKSLKTVATMLLGRFVICSFDRDTIGFTPTDKRFIEESV